MTTETTQLPWTSHLEAMDVAIAASNASAAVLAWRHAYSCALDQPGWRGLVDVAGAALRIGAIPGFKKAAESRARESYWTALFRARRQGSLNGVLDAAEAFGALGDRVMVEQCVRIAERLATLLRIAEWLEPIAAAVAPLVASSTAPQLMTPVRPAAN